MKIGLFGGSFNPIHNDHLGIIKNILKNKIVDEIWIIPTNTSPFDKKLLNYTDRINMIKKAIKNISNIKINKVEFNSKGKNYTCETIKKLKKQFIHNFFFIVGSDILPDFEKWKNCNYLLENLKFIIVKRKGYLIKKIENMNVKTIINLNEKISSTQIRELAIRNKDFSKLVPKTIYSYIRERGIYNGI